MQGLNTKRAPHPSVVIPHFVFGSVSFLVFAILLILSTNELTGHYFQAKILAITHVATLGWITMIIFGALYQLIPVVLEVPLYSEKLAKISFWLLAIGIIGMVQAFWVFRLDMMLVGPSGVVLLVFILFALNVLLTATKATKWSIESSLILSAVIWFVVTGIIGFLIALNFTNGFLINSHLVWLKVHANIGMSGWFFLLIIGVGAKLIPMFLLSHNLNRKKLLFSLYAVNTGLLFFFVDNAFLFLSLDFVSILLIASGLISFMSFLYESYKKRARKKLDIGLKHTMVSIVLLILPILLAFFLSLNPDLDTQVVLRINILYGFSILIGFISSLILGQTYKTLPFIVWLSRYQQLVGKFKTPLPKDLYSEKLLNWQFWLYNIAIVLLLSGIITGIKIVLMIGSYLLLLTAVVYNLNIFKILFHKVKKEGLS